MRYVYFALLLVCSGCSSLGFTNEDSGIGAFATEASVPANGKLIFSVERAPNTDMNARQYYKDMSVSRSFFGWFKNSAGKARSHVGGANGS